MSLWKREGCQTESKLCRQDRPRARPGFVKPIRNGLRKVQNLIKYRPSRAEISLAERENGIRFQKEEYMG